MSSSLRFTSPNDMKEFFSHIRGSVASTLVLAIVCCGLYPLIVFAISQAFFYEKANGSLILDKDGAVRGSKLLAQGFTADKYFHPRPSAAGNGYDATSSGGSNLGPTSQKLSDAIKERIAAYRAENGLRDTDHVRQRSGPTHWFAQCRTPKSARREGSRFERRKSPRTNSTIHRCARSGRPGRFRRQCFATESRARQARH